MTLVGELLETCYTGCCAELDWKNEKLCTAKRLNSVEEEQHSSNTLVVVQENNTGVFVTNRKTFVISKVSLKLHLPYWSFRES